MSKIKSKVNRLVYIMLIILITIILFIDSDTLNSLFINNNEQLLVKQVNTYKEEKLVYNEAPASTNDKKVTFINNNVNKWVWPTQKPYVITSNYGYRWGSMHKALDITGPGKGSNIYAANSGVVTTVRGGCKTGNLSCNGRGGNYIIIKHNINNYYTLYMHLQNIYVSTGQTVSSGQVIGTMGNTGNVRPVPTSKRPNAGTHLHFSLYKGEPYKGGYAINPMNLY